MLTTTVIAAAVARSPARAPSVAVTDATRKIAATGARFSGPCDSNGIVISQPTAVSTKMTSIHHGTQRSAKYCSSLRHDGQDQGERRRLGGV